MSFVQRPKLAISCDGESGIGDRGRGQGRYRVVLDQDIVPETPPDVDKDSRQLLCLLSLCGVELS